MSDDVFNKELNEMPAIQVFLEISDANASEFWSELQEAHDTAANESTPHRQREVFAEYLKDIAAAWDLSTTPSAPSTHES